MVKRISSIFLALLMMVSVFSMGFSAFGADTNSPADDEIPERYSVISSGSYNLSISGLTASCYGSLKAQYSTSLKIKLELQKKSSGTYSTIKTWSDSKTGVSITLSGSKVINPLSNYRLKVTFTAGNETVVYYDYP